MYTNSVFSGKGVITGMLKTGRKSLYVFDRNGHHYQVQPPCILDFYVHESRQRSGLGKRLFEHMLQVHFFFSFPHKYYRTQQLYAYQNEAASYFSFTAILYITSRWVQLV